LRNAWAIELGLVTGLLAAFCGGATIAKAQTAGASPTGGAPANATAAMPAPVSDRRFDILEYVIDGNTALSVPDVETAVYPFLGEQRSAADVDMAREALEEAYKSRGFQAVQVTIPQQGVETGIIHLEVIENPVGRLRVVNSRFHSLDDIKANAPSVTEGKVVNTTAVQADIVALNQQPNLTITPKLKAGQLPGTVDVDLEVEDHPPMHASVEVNNQYSQSTSDLRVIGSVGYDNLWQLGHSFSFSYLTAPENQADARVMSGTYLARIPRSSVSLLGYGVLSDSNVAALAGTDVIGKGTIFGARAIVNLPGSDGFYQSFTAGMDRKNLSQNVVTGGVPSDATVLYYPVSLAYAATWQMAERVTKVDASLNFALPAGSPSAKFDRQRFDALRSYFYFRGDVSHAQPLPWGFVVYGKLAGQLSDDSLLSSEQLSAGGENTVRGYLEAERLGDNGGTATLEIRSPSFGQAISPYLKDWHFLAFADGATLWLNNPLTGQRTPVSIAGAGIGTRFNILDRLNGAADFAFALMDGAITHEGTTRLHFRVWSGF
jgi:hemolysin activation/secretion protein